MRPFALAFDVYGTLIDTHGLVAILQQSIGDNAVAFSQTWRDKQLEYSFRRGLMKQYADFSICTHDALEYSCGVYQVPLSGEQKQTLLAAYRTLPVFADVKEGLTKLQACGHRMFAFSNGSADAVASLLTANDIGHFFTGTTSVEEVQTFKPDPAVYRYFRQKNDPDNNGCWLISGNPFDIIGALAANFKTAWIKRSADAVFDPWGGTPTVTSESLLTLDEKIAEF